MTPEPPAQLPWRRYALGGAGGMFVAMGLGRFSYTAMVPALVEAGALDPVAAGRVGMVNLAGFLLGAIVSVPVARAIGRGRTLRLALIAAIVGLAGSALPGGFAWLAGCRGLIGIATSLVMVLALALIAETAPADRRAAAAGYVFAGVGFGIMSSGVLVPALLSFGLEATWLGLFAAALAGAGIALWGWHGASEPPAMLAPQLAASTLPAGVPSIYTPALAGLLLAHALFSFGIVPHTLYWVDFIVRGQGLGTAAGGAYWTIVGLCAVLGPIVATLLARPLGIGLALVAGFVVLAIGVGLPAVVASPGALLASSIIFGAQPGLSSLMAARARDLGTPETMGRIMRAMILANAVGGVAGGLIVPWVYGAAADHAALFLLGGAALALGAVAAWPRRPPS